MTSNTRRSVTKVLSKNDLGITGSHQAGIVLPRNGEILALFPTLDASRYNPRCQVTVYEPRTGSHHTFQMIYYNGKLLGMSTRNEYRLTGMTKMLRDMGAGPGDHLTFTRTGLGDLTVTLESNPAEAPAEDMEPTPAVGRTLRGGWTIVDDGGER